MATWDVFHSDRMEVDRDQETDAVRDALARGEIRDDDLVRPAGSSAPWMRMPEWLALIGPAAAETRLAESKPLFPPAGSRPLDDPLTNPMTNAHAAGGDFALDLDEEGGVGLTVGDTGLPPGGYDDWPEMVDPLDEDEEAAEFTLSRGGPGHVEELDLAAMVDVAFQLVLFFLVTATTVMFKTLEMPKPNPENQPGAVAQGQARTLDDLEKDYILVQIDAQGEIRVDKEPVTPKDLVERLRLARKDTGRGVMLLQADFATLHRNAVLAYDAANEIGLRIAISKPAEPTSASPAPAKTAAPG